MTIGIATHAALAEGMGQFALGRPATPALPEAAPMAFDDLLTVASYAYRVHDLMWSHGVPDYAGETWQTVDFLSPSSDDLYLSLRTIGDDLWAAYDINDEALGFPLMPLMDLVACIAAVLRGELRGALAEVLGPVEGTRGAPVGVE